MTEKEKHESPEGRAAQECAKAAGELIDGWTGAEIAVGAFGQAQQSQAALNGLVRLLLHKGIVSVSDLSSAMRHAYEERADQLKAQREKADRGSAIFVPPPPTARGN